MKLVETSDGELKVRRPLGPTFRFTQLLPVLSSGLIVGLVGALLSISFGALIFVGPLAPFVASGIGLALAGTILTGLVIGFLSSLPGTVAGNQDVSSAILAVM